MHGGLSNLSDMGRLFKRSSHARKMAIAAILNKDSAQTVAQIAEAVYSGELIAAAEAGLLPVAAFAPICRRGMMTGKSAQSIVECFPRLLASGISPNQYSPILHLALAHPNLPEETWRKISDLRSEGVTDSISHALTASPHADARKKRRMELGLPFDSFMLPSCAFGDLTDRNLRTRIMRWFPNSTKGVHELASELLMANKTFCVDMAEAMHGTLTGDNAKNISHSVLRRFMESSEDVEYVNRCPDAARFVLLPDGKVKHAIFSPAIDEAYVEKEFSRIPPASLELSTEASGYTLNQSCPGFIFRTLVDKQNMFLGCSDFIGGPFDGEILALARGGKIPFERLSAGFLASRPETTREDFARFVNGGTKKLDLSEIVKVCSHENFDFSFLPDKIRRQDPVAIVEVASGKFSGGEPASPLAALFSEQTSAFRLEKNFKKLPTGLRRLAAAHPNGDIFPLDPDDPLDSKIAGFRQECFPVAPLANRHGATHQESREMNLVL